jgi:parallel beta-helix repeat protein
MKGDFEMKRIVSHGLMILAVLLFCTSAFVLCIQTVRASGTIHIRANGSVEGTDKIQRAGVIYTFTANINDSIVVEKSSIVIDGAGYTLLGRGSGRGIDLSGEEYVTIRNIRVEEFTDGIWLSGSSHNNITANTITNNADDGIDLRDSSNYNSIAENSITNNLGDGAELWSSSYNDIAENSIRENRLHGIWIYDNSYHNDISRNTIAENHYDGIVLLSSSNYNTVRNNTIEKNQDDGITLTDSFYNSIYYNKFINNTNQVSTDSVNTWDYGYPSGGNYWSDYGGVDLRKGIFQNENGSDGIGDTPYIINSNNEDRFPQFSISTGGGLELPLWIIVVAVVATCIVAATALVLHRRKLSLASIPPPPPPPQTQPP